MRRRSFLKLLGLALGAFSISLPFAWTAVLARSAPVAYGGKLYKADRHGRILVSVDDGRTWQVHTSLGAVYTISQLAVSSGHKLHAKVSYRRRSFALVLDADGRRWRTISSNRFPA